MLIFPEIPYQSLLTQVLSSSTQVSVRIVFCGHGNPILNLIWSVQWQNKKTFRGQETAILNHDLKCSERKVSFSYIVSLLPAKTNAVSLKLGSH